MDHHQSSKKHVVSPGDEYLELGKEADVMSVGKHCVECRQLDFLPLKTSCGVNVCHGCMPTHEHNCNTCKESKASQSRTLPTCPKCNHAILLPPSTPSVTLDSIVSAHIESGCTKFLADNKVLSKTKTKKKNRCAAKGCKESLSIISMTCDDCQSVFCPRHRFPSDHRCKGSACKRTGTDNCRQDARAENSPFRQSWLQRSILSK